MRRAVCIASAGGILAALWGLPWTGWVGAFPVHMLRHIVLVAVVAPLLALAIPERFGPWAPPALLGAVIEFFVVWGWHLPAFHMAADADTLVEILQYASFLAVGCAVWWGAVAAASPLVGAGALFLTSMHMTLLGAILIFSNEVICGNDTSLAAQHLGAMIMLVIGTPAYLIGGLVLAARALAMPEEREA